MEKSVENKNGKPNYWIYLAAYLVSQKMLTICGTDMENFDKGDPSTDAEVYIVDKENSPEVKAIKKDSFDNLSAEAKFVIDLLVKEEFEDIVYSKKHKKDPTKTKLRRILHSKFSWTRLKLNRTFKELSEYAKDL